MTKTLGDICSLQGGFAFKSKDFSDFGVPVIKIANVTGGTAMNYAAMQCVPSEVAASANRFQSKPGDTLISMTGANVGKITRVWPNEPVALINQRVGRFIPKAPDEFSQDFIHYVVLSHDSYEFFRNAAYGSAQPNISASLIESLPLPNIGLNNPNTIGALCRSLDDKIELNRKMAATLEEMARALYRSWFVDFDPVHARSQGNTPTHMDQPTAALFPDSFGEDGLPMGWTMGKLSDLSDLNSQKHSKTSHPDTLVYVDLANTKWGLIESTTSYSWEDAPSRARMKLSAGDTIVGTVRPGNGSYSYVGGNGLTGSTGFAVLSPKNLTDGPLIYLAATDVDTIGALANLADGAAYPAVRPDVVAARPICIANNGIRSDFAKQTQALIDKIEANKLENQTLATLRDTLLPRLMSGELRVGDAHQKVEDVI